MTDKHSALAIVRPLGIQLEVDHAEVTLDEAWSPYCQVTLTCAMPSDIDRALIDLRPGPLRLDLRLRRDFGEPWKISQLPATIAGWTAMIAGGPLANITHQLFAPWDGVERPSQLRIFDLYMREPVFDDNSEQVTIVATSDEALLLGDILTAAAALDPSSTSVVAIVNQVLARYGATLDPSSVDAVVAMAAATLWQPGDDAHAHIDPLLEPASLRLWCDENRVWRTSARESSTPGSVVLSPANMTKHKDSTTLDPAVWADAVSIKYTWTDALGVGQVAYDYAGAQPSRSGLALERQNTVFPGPGAAAGILSRSQGRGRVEDIEIDNDYSLTPGMSATVIAPDGVFLSGYVSAVTWNFPEAEMRVPTRGLVQVPPDSYLFGDDTTFAAVATTAPTLAISAFDWSLV